MRKVYSLVVLLILWTLVGTVCAEEFKLTSGETVTGEAVLPTANDQGIQIKIAEGQYQKVAWGNFSQDDLKKFAANAKLEPFVQPFIEVNPEEKIKRTEPNLKEPPTKLAQPPRTFLLSAMFSSSLGLLMLLLVYAANIYAAYEVSIFRAQPTALVCGLAAIPGLGFLSPPIFLALPTKVKAAEQAAPAAAEEAVAAAEPAAEEVNPMHADGAAHPAGLKLADSEADKGKSALPETVVFQRGQFTFNRRFFETKFPGFFGVVRREAEKDMVLVVKASRGEYTAQRISRIAANDVHLQIQKGHTSEEVLVPFQEIQEIRLKHKEA